MSAELTATPVRNARCVRYAPHAPSALRGEMRRAVALNGIALTVASVALGLRQKESQPALDELEDAHLALGGRGRGRRYATLQINHAYAMLVSSQFQGFCRNLHSEAVDVLASSPSDRWAGNLLRVLLTQGRKLDHGNPNPGNLGADFGAIGMRFWDDIRQTDARAENRKLRLEELNGWRNAIAHQDWTKVGGSPTLHLGTVRGWRSACNGLAGSFDRAVQAHLVAVVGQPPW